nr:unnamed protein product [Callosobruchus analis]
MNGNDKSVKIRLIAKRNNIKTKLEQLRHGEILQEEMFNPITKRLKSIESTLQNKQATNRTPYEHLLKGHLVQTVKKDVNDEKKEGEEIETVLFENTDNIKTPASHLPRRLSFKSSPSDDDLSRFQYIEESSFNDYLERYDPLPRKYINDMYKNTENKEFDHKYGVRHDKMTETFMVGDSKLNIVAPDIYVQEVHKVCMSYKYPNEAVFTDEDKKNYKQIVYKTNAHKRYYRPGEQVDGSKLKKYKNIIAPSIKGQGLMMEVTGNKKDYIYWDDPNELVDRLRLLLSSQAAGHTGHANEIISLIEELREVNIVL